MSNTKIGAKEKIINAAWELFREKGYEETTLQDIIDKSGTSRGAFYHHFRAKEDLLFRMAWYFDKNIKAGWTHWIQILLSLKNYFCSMNTAAVYWKNLNLSLSFSSFTDMRS